MFRDKERTSGELALAVLLGIVAIAALYVGTYLLITERSNHYTAFKCRDAPWQVRVYYPVILVEHRLRGNFIVVFPGDGTSFEIGEQSSSN